MIVYYSMEFFRKKKKKSWTVVLKKVFFYSMAVINVLTIAVAATTFKPFFINVIFSTNSLLFGIHTV